VGLSAATEELVRHELVMRVVELRQENYWLREQLRQVRLENPDIELLKARIRELTTQLAESSWNEPLEGPS
jgi:hypothetical protein